MIGEGTVLQRIKRTIKHLFFPMAVLFVATSFTGAYFSDTVSVTNNSFNTGSWGGEPASARVVINEIDYDQPSTDTAEFVELKNIGNASANLGEYTLKLVNGANGLAAVYQTITLPNVDLAANDYFVVCSNSATVSNCDLDIITLIQNGPADAVALTKNELIIDTVSYEGNIALPYLEGSAVGLEDSGSLAGSIARFPDGTDTDQNNIDFQFRPITPGTMNL